MDYSGRIISVLGVAAYIFLGVFSFSTEVLGAVAPLVSALPPVTGGVSTPVRLAADSSGNTYVSDPRGGGILTFDSSGNLLQTITTLKKVFGIAIAANDDLLVSQGTSVAVLNKSTGALLSTFGTFISSNGITVDSSGKIYVTDSLNSCVQVFSAAYAPVNTGIAAAGKPANSFGTFGKATGQFVRPTGISYEKISNQLAIVDTLAGQVQFYSPTGIYQSSIGSFGSGPLQFTAPQGIAFEYTKDGTALSRIYIVDSYQSNIQVIDAATRLYLSSMGGYGTAAGQLVTPGDLLYDRFDPLNNRLMVANGTGKLALFSIDMITGNCGTAHNGSFVDAPTDNLCKNGNVTNFTGSGPWFWSCAGQNGGTTATCSASASVYQATVTIIASNGGSGSVTSNPSGINCLSGTCSANFTPGSSLLLMARANTDSTFSGWGGDCSSSGVADCTVSMTADHKATATFTLTPYARVNNAVYGTLTKAYEAVGMSSAGVIEAQAHTFIENLVFSRGSDITLRGGFDSGYNAARTGYTVLNGTLKINSGRLVADRLVIR